MANRLGSVRTISNLVLIARLAAFLFVENFQMKSTAILLLATLFTVPAVAQESSKADFEEFCKAMQGRWVGDVVWTNDWPGLGEKGDKVKAYAEIKIIEDGNALLGRFYGGNGSATWLTDYDAASKTIRENWVTSGGTTWTKTWYKEDGKWVGILEASNPDGSKVESKDILTISENGNKHSYSGTSTVEGKAGDERQDVWVRVSDK